jgi:hypothetical protein
MRAQIAHAGEFSSDAYLVTKEKSKTLITGGVKDASIMHRNSSRNAMAKAVSLPRC